MKKYFSKLLPTDGEIKEGDYFLELDNVGNTTLYKYDNPLSLAHHDHLVSRKKAKLFLCSRDIQYVAEVKSFKEACEKVKHQDIVKRDGKYYQIFFGPEHDSELEIEYIVIGEISPKATWVTENQEFDEDEIKLQCYDDSGVDNLWFDYIFVKYEDKWEDIPLSEKRVQIKCKCCNKFC